MQGTGTIVRYSTGALFSFMNAAIHKHAAMYNDDMFDHLIHRSHIWSLRGYFLG